MEMKMTDYVRAERSFDLQSVNDVLLEQDIIFQRYMIETNKVTGMKSKIYQYRYSQLNTTEDKNDDFDYDLGLSSELLTTPEIPSFDLSLKVDKQKNDNKIDLQLKSEQNGIPKQKLTDFLFQYKNSINSKKYNQIQIEKVSVNEKNISQSDYFQIVSVISIDKQDVSNPDILIESIQLLEMSQIKCLKFIKLISMGKGLLNIPQFIQEEADMFNRQPFENII